MPEPNGPAALTISDSGQVTGHVALWSACHTGYADGCLAPPRSSTGYALFHQWATPVSDGGKVVAGRLTFGTGHADPQWDAPTARDHYRTGKIAADVRAINGRHGIWCAGAARHLTDVQLREVMSSPPSGDWRRFGNDMELVALLAVNVPGFNTPRVRMRDGLVASLIAPPPQLRRRDNAAIIERIARTIGRSRPQRIAALTARVHPR